MTEHEKLREDVKKLQEDVDSIKGILTSIIGIQKILQEKLNLVVHPPLPSPPYMRLT